MLSLCQRAWWGLCVRQYGKYAGWGMPAQVWCRKAAQIRKVWILLCFTSQKSSRLQQRAILELALNWARPEATLSGFGASPLAIATVCEPCHFYYKFAPARTRECECTFTHKPYIHKDIYTYLYIYIYIYAYI